jgi:nicotinamidase-related amidase
MFFPVGSLPTFPQLETRKALLILDLQNDFLQEDGNLFVHNTKEFLPKLPSLVAKFREKGDVFWTQTEFHEPRPITCPDLESYVVVLEDLLPHAKSNGADPDYRAEQFDNSPSPSPGEVENDDPEAFLTQRSTTDGPRCCLPGTYGCAVSPMIASLVDHTRDSTVIKTDYSAFQTKSLLPTLRVKLITELYLCGSLSNISVYATALDAVRHGLQVTIIEDCVGYRNGKCHEEAMRQMADAMGVNGIDYQELMDDLLGNLGEVVTASTFTSAIGTRQVDGDASSEHYTMRSKVKRWMDDLSDTERDHGRHCNSEGIDGAELYSAKRRSLSTKSGLSVSTTGNLEKAPTTPQKRSNERLENDGALKKSALRQGQNAKPSRIRVRRSRMNPEAAGHKSALPATSDHVAVHDSPVRPNTLQSSKSTIEADSDPDRSILDEMSSLVDKAKAFGRTLRGAKHSKQNSSTKVLGPGDFIGERDSRIVHDFLPVAHIADDAFRKLRIDDNSCEVRWQKMYHRSGEVPRLVAVQGETRSDGSIPIYRHPADELPPLLPFSATVQSIREEVEKAVGHPINHVLIQLYRSGEDNISEHSDKTLDIVRGSFIVNVTLGARRTMTLRTKKSASGPHAMNQQRRASAPASSPPSPNEAARLVQRIPLPHNSLFILGQDTNQIWMHAIRADKRPTSEKSAEELAFNGERISLTFRNIGTFINPESGTIWGQGATSKTEQGAKLILEGKEAEREGEKMIRAFGQENHQSHDFDWQAQYGAGFDVVKFEAKTEAGNTG